LMLTTDWRSLVEHIESLRVRFTVLDVGHGPLPPELAGTEDEDAYWRTTRVNWTADLPYSLNTVYVAERLANQKKEEFESEPILPVLARHFKDELRKATQVLTIRAADAMAARQMQIDIGTPIVQALRSAKNSRQQTVYAARVLYPAKYLYIETNF